MYFSTNVLIKNCIVNYEHGVSDIRLMKRSSIYRTLAFVERATVNPQVSLLKLILEAGIPGDVMWSLIDGKHIAYCVSAAS